MHEFTKSAAQGAVSVGRDYNISVGIGDLGHALPCNNRLATCGFILSSECRFVCSSAFDGFTALCHRQCFRSDPRSPTPKHGIPYCSVTSVSLLPDASATATRLLGHADEHPACRLGDTAPRPRHVSVLPVCRSLTPAGLRAD